MTAKPQHTPIYSRSDLAKLVSTHDREYPNHGNDCSCHNGLINMLRIYFAPVEPVSDFVPQLYVPPDAIQPTTDHNADDVRKPWLRKRDGETQEQYDHRISHSCYNCGEYIVDRKALDRHEDECCQQGRRTITGNS